MEKQKFKHLFSPYKIGNVTIKNRFVSAPTGTVPISPLSMFDADAMNVLIERAKGGFGLIYTPAYGVDMDVDTYNPYDKVHPLYNPKNFTKNSTYMNYRIHAYGAKIFAQLGVGVGRNGGGQKAPSELPEYFNPNNTTKALTKEEIQKKIENTVKTAFLCKNSGYDGVEIHALHWGFLLDQFAMNYTNNRIDEYGDSLENRLRICREIVEGVKAACGKDFPVTMRMGLKSYMQGFKKGSLYGEEEEVGRDIEESMEICKLLESYGYDAVDADAGNYDSFYHACPTTYVPQGFYLPLAEKAKSVLKNIPLLMAGRMDDPAMCEEAIAGGVIDFAVLGRAAIADPHFPKKVQAGRLDKIRPCMACNQGCIGAGYSHGASGCAVNPAVFRSESYGIQKAMQPKKVLVAGGGVAGMEVARTATIRGHQVILCEAGSVLGGNLIPAGAHSFKKPVHRLNDWYQNELKELGVEVRLNTEVTAERIKEENPDAVVLALGSKPIMPQIAGVEKSISSIEALSGNKKIGSKVVIVGGGLVGCEIAIDYAMEGKEVELVEALDSVLSSGAPVPFMNKTAIEDLLEYYKVKVHTGCKIKEVTDEGAIAVKADGEETLSLSADTVVMAIGFRPAKSIAADLSGIEAEIYEIGDGRQVGTILTAVWDAYEVARTL